MFKITFFGYDFDEKYVQNYKNNKVVVSSSYGEIKRYKIEHNTQSGDVNENIRIV